MPFSPVNLQWAPGIQRDGSQLASEAYTDGRWTRFQRGKPRKMGGYQTLSSSMTAISRALHSQSSSGNAYIHSGFTSGIESYQVDPNGVTTFPSARTPGGFTTDPNNIWQLDATYDPIGNQQIILAFVVPGLADIAYGSTTGALYSGNIYTVTALTAVAGLATDATGGVMALPPYSVVYGSNGLVQWSAPSRPLDMFSTGSGAARVTHQKIVRGMALRGGGSYSPSALLWSLDAVVRMYFIGGLPVFAFDQLTTNSSILSHNAVVECDGQYFWAAKDRFMVYNGVVREIPNDKNINYFFDNLNTKYAQKVFATKVTRYGEIWWCFPFGNATEPNHAVVFNYREGTWYDTQLPNSGRSVGIENDISAGNLFSGVDIYPGGTTYRLWQHEVGVDEVDVSNINAIDSYFTSPILTAEKFQQPMDRDLHIDTLIPDFVQTGPMTVTPFTRGNARSTFVTPKDTINFDAVPTNVNEQQVPIGISARQIKLQFESNVQGGNYQAGNHVAYIETDQGRRTA